MVPSLSLYLRSDFETSLARFWQLPSNLVGFLVYDTIGVRESRTKEKVHHKSGTLIGIRNALSAEQEEKKAKHKQGVGHTEKTR